MKILEITVLPKPHNRKEFRQPLEDLSKNLHQHCSSLKIDELEEGVTFYILVKWKTAGQMHNALMSDEFTILTGAISALSEKTIIQLDGKEVGINISELKLLRSSELLQAISKQI